MSAIIYNSLIARKSSRPFAVGLGRVRAERLPKGPSAADREWAALHLNDDADPSEGEVRDRHEMLTLSRSEYRGRVRGSST